MSALVFTDRSTGINKACCQYSGIMILWMRQYSYLRSTGNLLDVFLIASLCNIIRISLMTYKQAKIELRKMDAEQFSISDITFLAAIPPPVTFVTFWVSPPS